MQIERYKVRGRCARGESAREDGELVSDAEGF